MTDRPPPPITVRIPGCGPARAELLAVGPAPQRSGLPTHLVGTGLAAAAVLLAGVLVAVDQRGAPPPPRRLPSPVTVDGVAATASLTQEDELVTRLSIEVAVDAPATGRGDTGGSSEPEQLSLIDLRARGFQVRLVAGSLPVRLGDLGRFGSGVPYDVQLRAEAVVTDCSVEVGAQRGITASLRRGDGPVGTLRVEPGPGVVRALDRLVSRSCRRPRG